MQLYPSTFCLDVPFCIDTATAYLACVQGLEWVEDTKIYDEGNRCGHCLIVLS